MFLRLVRTRVPWILDRPFSSACVYSSGFGSIPLSLVLWYGMVSLTLLDRCQSGLLSIVERYMVDGP